MTLAVGLSAFVCTEKNSKRASCIVYGPRSLPGVMFPCGCLCVVLNSYCQLFTRDNIPSGNEKLASLARPYFPTVWFTRLGESLGTRPRLYQSRESVDSLCRDGADTPIVCVYIRKLFSAHVLSLSRYIANVSLSTQTPHVAKMHRHTC